jgi:hypothetical protein
MNVLTVCYPSGPDAWFDFDHYVNKHIPLDLEILPPLKTPLPPGIPRAEAVRGVPGLDGSPAPFICIGRVWINEPSDFLALAQDQRAAADLAKYTNIEPVVCFGTAVTG